MIILWAFKLHVFPRVSGDVMRTARKTLAQWNAMLDILQQKRYGRHSPVDTEGKIQNPWAD